MVLHLTEGLVVAAAAASVRLAAVVLVKTTDGWMLRLDAAATAVAETTPTIFGFLPTEPHFDDAANAVEEEAGEGVDFFGSFFILVV